MIPDCIPCEYSSLLGEIFSRQDSRMSDVSTSPAATDVLQGQAKRAFKLELRIWCFVQEGLHMQGAALLLSC